MEELSLKHIKQIEELNNTVKVANDAINGIVEREDKQLGVHLGSMMAEVPVVGLSKKQRKRRRDSRLLGLRHLAEEMGSNDSKASVYDTFHGAEQRKRSSSWSELHH